MATSIFARIGTIKGESRDSKHKDEIDVLSWSWGVSRSGTAGHVGGGSGAGKATFDDFVFTHHVDKATPALLKACASGEHLPEAVISARKAGKGQQDYLVVTMTDVVVSSVSMSVSAEADASIESVVLTFAKVDLEYRPQKADGTLDAGTSFQHELKARAKAKAKA